MVAWDDYYFDVIWDLFDVSGGGFVLFRDVLDCQLFCLFWVDSDAVYDVAGDYYVFYVACELA